MLIETKAMHGCKIHAIDGEIGTIDELLFDDRTWSVRYLIVATGSWLFERKVLIAPASLGLLDWDTCVLSVNLTRDQIENSPDVDTDKPVSRQWENDYYRYYALPYYWGGSAGWGQTWASGSLVGQLPIEAAQLQDEDGEQSHEHDDPHLRSTKAVAGYKISASDGHIGHVRGFIVDDSTWKIQYLSVNTVDWWPGKKVLLPHGWISSINWPSGVVAIEATRLEVQNVPEWDTDESITSEFEEKLYNYYSCHQHHVREAAEA